MGRSFNVNEEGNYGLWKGRVLAAARGKNGRAVLQELKDALLALPEKRLIEGDVITSEGDVCAVGALALHRKRASFPEFTEQQIVEEVLKDAGGLDGEETADFGELLGMKWCLSWTIAWANDDYYSQLSDEDRYTKMLETVDLLLEGKSPRLLG